MSEGVNVDLGFRGSIVGFAIDHLGSPLELASLEAAALPLESRHIVQPGPRTFPPSLSLGRTLSAIIVTSWRTNPLKPSLSATFTRFWRTNGPFAPATGYH